MSQLSLDLSIFNKFNFKGPPVGVKFMFHKPEGIERLDKNIAFCVMVKEAQERGAAESMNYMAKELSNYLKRMEDLKSRMLPRKSRKK